MIDSEGYRANVGIVLSNSQGELLWCRRIGQDAWQFPQGGIEPGESPEQALYRELYEEIGLGPEDVTIIGNTRGWLRYRLPENLMRRDTGPLCIGQKQLWFLLRILDDQHSMCFDKVPHPEFDDWRWVGYWRPVKEVVYFKRDVYKQALRQLKPMLSASLALSTHN